MYICNYSWEKVSNNIEVHGIGCESRCADAYNFACLLPKDEKIIVFHTCSFIENRHTEDIIILNLLKEIYPDHKFYVTGCDTSFNADCYKPLNIQTNNDIDWLISYIPRNPKCVSDSHVINLKIQDGCNNRCTYCAMNQYYNNPKSMTYNKIKEVLNSQIIEKPNADKVVLCGTEIASYYDKEHKMKLSDMLKQLIQDYPNLTFALTAIDPATKEAERVIPIIANREHFIPYLLLGVQSGSDTILKAMKRRHNTKRVRHLHKLAQEHNVTVGWDLIVGFPGETDKLFHETVELVKELKPIMFDIFEYSDRKGTPSSLMKNKVSEETKKIRSYIIRQYIRSYYNSDFLSYYNGDDAMKHVTQLKAKALEYIENNNEIYLDIFNKKDVVEFLKSPKDSLVHVRYDIDRELESSILISFITGYLKNTPVMIHVPKEFKQNYDVKEAECIFRGIIQGEINEII